MQNQNNGGYVQPQNQNVQSNVQNQVKVTENKITELVIKQIETFKAQGKLVIPSNYVPANALQAAYLEISKNSTTSRFLYAKPGSVEFASLAKTLLDMVVLGLNPSKRQCYFIPYGNELKLFKSYFGDVAVCKASGLIKDIRANVIYEGDEIIIDYDEQKKLTVISHKTKFGNQDNTILGCYAVVILPDDTKMYEVMTKKQIDTSWNQSKTKANNQYQTNFPDEACKRTVIRRAVKMLMNSSNDSNLVISTYNKTNDDEYKSDKLENAINVTEVKEVANAKTASKPLNTFDSGVVQQPQVQPMQQQVRSTINNIVNKKSINQPTDPFENVSDTAYQNLGNDDSQAINDNDYAYEETDIDDVTDF